MYCQYCGAKLGEKARFCQECGRRITLLTSPSPSPMPPAPSTFQPRRQSKPQPAVCEVESPQPVINSDAEEQFEPMRLKDLLFSTVGRIGRIRFLVSYISLFILYIAFVVLVAFLFPHAKAHKVFGAATVVLIWPSIAIWVKRLQDCDRSAFSLLLLLIPIIGIAVVIYAFVAKGTDGPNKYGPATNVLPLAPPRNDASAWS